MVANPAFAPVLTIGLGLFYSGIDHETQSATPAKEAEPKRQTGRPGYEEAQEGLLIVLTPKQEAFCLAYIETGNASEAYRRSYDAGKMAATTINRNAKALLDNNKIAARVAEVRAPALEKVQLSLERHLNDLQALRDKADAAEKYGPAIAAEIARGKASGLYVEKTEVTGANGGPIDMNWTVQFVKPTDARRATGKA